MAIFATCFGNYNEPDLGEDLIKVLEHNQIEVTLVPREQCCGMPKLELGDLKAVEKAKQANIPVLAKMVGQGWDIIAPVPSCVLMLRQELPLMFDRDEAVQTVASAVFDPFEYLMERHHEGLLNTAFKKSLGKVAYHAACHQRVQKIGMKTKQCLQLVPDTEVITIERCSGHNGTYGVKRKFYQTASQNFAPGSQQGQAVRCRSLRQRLPDGRALYRARHGGWQQNRASDFAFAACIQNLGECNVGNH